MKTPERVALTVVLVFVLTAVGLVSYITGDEHARADVAQARQEVADRQDELACIGLNGVPVRTVDGGVGCVARQQPATAPSATITWSNSTGSSAIDIGGTTYFTKRDK